MEYDKLIMICESAINITGQPLSVYELTIVQDGEIYVVLEAYGDYYYVKKSDKGGNQGDQNGDNTDENTNADEEPLMEEAPDTGNYLTLLSDPDPDSDHQLHPDHQELHLRRSSQRCRQAAADRSDGFYVSRDPER